MILKCFYSFLLQKGCVSVNPTTKLVPDKSAQKLPQILTSKEVFVTRRNLIAMLISVELVLNAVDINFAAFNRLLFPGEFEGFFMTLFSMGVSAAESAVAIAIVINVYRNFHSDQVNSIENMKY